MTGGKSDVVSRYCTLSAVLVVVIFVDGPPSRGYQVRSRLALEVPHYLRASSACRRITPQYSDSRTVNLLEQGITK
jgi:hypothetical protein